MRGREAYALCVFRTKWEVSMRQLQSIACTIAVLGSLGVAATARAQTEELAGPVEWVLSPLFRDGQLVGCSIEYTAVVMNSSAAKDGVLGISGSVGVELSDKMFGGYLKGGVFTVNVQARQRDALPIQTFKLNLDGKVVQPFRTLESDVKGFKLFALEAKEAVEAFSATLTAELIRWTFKLPDRAYDQVVKAPNAVPAKTADEGFKCLKDAIAKLQPTSRR